MSEAMCRASLGTIKLLSDHGGNIKRGQLLHHAVQRAAPDVLELVGLLLDRDASLNEIQYENHAESWRDRCMFGLGTPLHYAAQRRNVQLLAFLLSGGADATIKGTKGRTAPQSVEYYRQPEVVDLFRTRLKLSPAETFRNKDLLYYQRSVDRATTRNIADNTQYP